MKRVLFCTAGLLFAVFSLCSCATTSNPAKGGFFSGVQGLTSGEYQNRVNQKQSSLEQLKETGSELRSRQQDLSQRSAALSSEEKAYRRQLAQMNDDLANLQARLRKARLRTRSGQARRVKLEKNIDTLQVQIQGQEQQSGLSEDQIRQQLESLMQEKSRLEREIVKLTSQ